MPTYAVTTIGRLLAAAACLFSLCAPGSQATAAAESRPVVPGLTAEDAGRFVSLALRCVHLEYPNKIAHVLNSDADARPPHELTPAFYGCYDWHSSVHGHWLLARAIRLFPKAPFVADARATLAQSLTTENIAAETHYLRADGRASFERPYGLAWLLQLAAELHEWKDPDAQRWAAALAPLEAEAAARIESWLPKLRYAIRIGEHSQTAFAFGLAWDWAAVTGDDPMRRLLVDKARQFYREDRRCPLAYEPSGEDFLSPCLAEADFMRRVLAPREFGQWLSSFLPGIPRVRGARPDVGGGWLAPGVVTDRADPKLAHIDGLNLSRAWMLEGIAGGLPHGDARIAALKTAAFAHRTAALPAATAEHYEGGHWLGTFALYLTSDSGRPGAYR
jgi:hypothetical protein